MADLYSQVESRFHALLAEGRGADGALGAAAQARAIPAGTFRRVADGAPLDDPSTPGELVDGSYTLRFTEAADDPEPQNPFDGVVIERVTMVVTVGYAQGAAASAFVHERGAESAATEVRRPDRRALSDGRRIKLALEYPPLRGVDTDPSIRACVRIGTAFREAAGGRSFGVTTFRLLLVSDGAAQYGP